VNDAAKESVWDYPRPPAVVPTDEHLLVEFGGVIADSRRALRVLETSHPPVYYVPVDDVRPGALVPVPGGSWCEYKGAAGYYDLVSADGRRAPRAAWYFPEPTAPFAALLGHVAIYPGRVVDGEVVRPQEGGFYGGWITDRVTGPFKGAPGTLGW
jgi:uncharacterized protein (DUF427 family)